ncbi:MAG: hypothetical protein E6Q97_19060 [Desulfurellales bacterium]|nr:MAG: hypothetical protein E6Q97_19060 [Desulfurellales bacterium]
MQRQTAIYNIARIIYEVAVEERGNPAELIDYMTGKQPPISTWSNAELAEQLEYLTGDEGVEVTGGKTPVRHFARSSCAKWRTGSTSGSESWML